MKGLLSGLSDGTLGVLARWYTRQHVKGCPHCRAALEALRVLRKRLRALAYDESDKSGGNSGGDTAATAGNQHPAHLS
jgi:hypothetical protein